MPNLGPTKDFSDAKYKMSTNQTLISNWALLAHNLGYAWCGGTNSEYVGEDFSTKFLSPSSYEIRANYRSGDPYASGYDADKRLVMTMSDMNVLIDPSKIQYSTPMIITLNPESIGVYYIENAGPSPITASRAFTYQLSSTVSHTSSYSFTEGMSLKQKWNVGIPGLGGNETEFEFNFSATQGWSDTSTKQITKTDELGVSVTVPANSKVGINLFAAQTKSEVNYQATAIYNYKMDLNSFMRWSGNARLDHPKDRPMFNFTFGTEAMSALEHLSDLYEHNYIDGYNKTWDWRGIEDKSSNIKSLIEGMVNDPVSFSFKGKFQNIFGTSVTYRIMPPEPLLNTPNDRVTAPEPSLDISDENAWQTTKKANTGSLRFFDAKPRKITSDFSTKSVSLIGVDGPGFFKAAPVVDLDFIEKTSVEKTPEFKV